MSDNQTGTGIGGISHNWITWAITFVSLSIAWGAAWMVYQGELSYLDGVIAFYATGTIGLLVFAIGSAIYPPETAKEPSPQ